MDCYIGEIRMFGGNFAPQGWLPCDGRTLSISEFDTLFALIGTTYGGDGQSTFKLPDLQGRIPVHVGNGRWVGTSVGSETVTLTSDQMASHSHTLSVGQGSEQTTPAGNLPGVSQGFNLYAPAVTAAATLAPSAVSNTGGGDAHDNIMPTLCVNFIIAVEGLWPPQP